MKRFKFQKVSFTDDLKYINDTFDTNNTITENPITENQSLRELIDLQYKFNDLSKNSSLSKIFDCNKSKDLKNVNELKLKQQLDDIFENDFNDLDENLFQLKYSISETPQQAKLIQEKIYDNRDKEMNYEDSKLQEGSYI